MSLNEEIAAVVRAAVAEALAKLAPKSENEKLLTREEAAKFLQITSRQLDILRKSAKPPPTLWVGDSPRFLARELVEWARERSCT